MSRDVSGPGTTIRAAPAVAAVAVALGLLSCSGPPPTVAPALDGVRSTGQPSGDDTSGASGAPALPSPTGEPMRPEELGPVVASLDEALGSAGLSALAAPDADEETVQLLATLDGLDLDLRLEPIRLVLPRSIDPPGAHVVEVGLELPVAPDQAAVASYDVTVSRGGSGLRIHAVQPERGYQDVRLWNHGPVEVHEGDHVRVLVDETAAAEFASQDGLANLDAAAREVDDVTGDPCATRPLVEVSDLDYAALAYGLAGADAGEQLEPWLADEFPLRVHQPGQVAAMLLGDFVVPRVITDVGQLYRATETGEPGPWFLRAELTQAETICATANDQPTAWVHEGYASWVLSQDPVDREWLTEDVQVAVQVASGPEDRPPSNFRLFQVGEVDHLSLSYAMVELLMADLGAAEGSEVVLELLAVPCRSAACDDDLDEILRERAGTTAEQLFARVLAGEVTG